MKVNNANPANVTDPRLRQVQSAAEELRVDWCLANYAVTMPGNIDAFIFAALGGLL